MDKHRVSTHSPRPYSRNARSAMIAAGLPAAPRGCLWVVPMSGRCPARAAWRRP